MSEISFEAHSHYHLARQISNPDVINKSRYLIPESVRKSIIFKKIIQMIDVPLQVLVFSITFTTYK